MWDPKPSICLCLFILYYFLPTHTTHPPHRALSTAQHNTTQHHMAQHDTAPMQYGTTQYTNYLITYNLNKQYTI